MLGPYTINVSAHRLTSTVGHFIFKTFPSLISYVWLKVQVFFTLHHRHATLLKSLFLFCFVLVAPDQKLTLRQQCM